jgi:hypothetical protein
MELAQRLTARILRALSWLDRQLPHPNGPFYFWEDVSKVCPDCYREERSARIGALHREPDTGRLHYHCPHCPAVTLIDYRKPALRKLHCWSAPQCSVTPPVGTLAWFKWSHVWHSPSAGLWRTDGLDTLYVLDPGPEGSLVPVPAPADVVGEYEGTQAFLASIALMTAGIRPPDELLIAQTGRYVRVQYTPE